MVINFNSSKEVLNKFSGSELKKTIIFNGDMYMIKFPDPIRESKNSLSYINNQFSEHIGSQIFKSCGINTQDTLLGYYNVNGDVKIVVACKDFTQDGSVLTEFYKVANANVSSDKKATLTIENVYSIIENTDAIQDKSSIINSFWDMFVVDALIGNTDRHFNNWGLLYKDNEYRFAPIYDCGSSLGALYSENKISQLLSNSTSFKNSEFNIRSIYKFEGKRIFYHEIFKNPPNDLKNAISRIVPRISIESINKIIDEIIELTEIKKDFLKKSILVRYEDILLPALYKISK